MTLTEIFLAQITDPFRIGLMAALCFTAFRLRHNSGLLVPLAVGALFFGVLLPTTMPLAGADHMSQIATGIVADLLIVAVLAGVWSAVQRLRK